MVPTMGKLGDYMRTVTFGAACSLDGFIARADHSVDWLRWSKDVSAITERILEDHRYGRDGSQNVYGRGH